MDATDYSDEVKKEKEAKADAKKSAYEIAGLEPNPEDGAK